MTEGKEKTMNIIEYVLKIGLFLFIYYAILISAWNWLKKVTKAKP
jgi:hypothetical protein